MRTQLYGSLLAPGVRQFHATNSLRKSLPKPFLLNLCFLHSSQSVRKYSKAPFCPLILLFPVILASHVHICTIRNCKQSHFYVHTETHNSSSTVWMRVLAVTWLQGAPYSLHSELLYAALHCLSLKAEFLS